jgi:predicted enzyme related to lactoylglutathione lyase
MTTSSEPQTRTGPITGVDIVAYFTSDPEKSIAFYRDVLGMTPTETDDQGRGAEFTLSDGSTFGVWRPDEPAAGAAVMFAVSDIHDALPRLRERGAQLSEAEETPVCFMAFGRDPDGNTIIIHQRKPSSSEN